MSLYVTQPIRNDGFGAQYQTIINTILYCKKYNKNYVYTPIKNMEHNYDNDKTFLNKAEELMNIKKYKSINDIDTKPIDTNIFQMINFFDNNIDKIAHQLKEVKDDFWQNKDKNIFNNDVFNIAVHIRRFNKHDNRIEGFRYASEEYYLNKILFHIYSQGNIEDFIKYNANDTILKINMNLFDTFKEMVGANALIMSKSSFSYTAAILSDGDIYYLNFWHPPMKHWYI
jgi:hypothetical protein